MNDAKNIMILAAVCGILGFFFQIFTYFKPSNNDFLFEEIRKSITEKKEKMLAISEEVKRLKLENYELIHRNEELTDENQDLKKQKQRMQLEAQMKNQKIEELEEQKQRLEKEIKKLQEELNKHKNTGP